MRYILLIASLASTFLFFSTTTQAARPCKEIVEACLSAGVIQKGASRQMMIENCMKPITEGKNISGVNIDASTIQACKEKIASQN